MIHYKFLFLGIFSNNSVNNSVSNKVKGRTQIDKTSCRSVIKKTKHISERRRSAANQKIFNPVISVAFNIVSKPKAAAGGRQTAQISYQLKINI